MRDITTGLVVTLANDNVENILPIWIGENTAENPHRCRPASRDDEGTPMADKFLNDL